jgi:coiled-coil domain-containing protein 40
MAEGNPAAPGAANEEYGMQPPGQEDDGEVYMDEEPEEEEQDEEEMYEQIRNMMENPVIQPIQEALKNQLLEADLRVSAELRDKIAELKAAKEERELTGVELYGVQQQLAKLQMDLENKHNTLNVVSNIRQKAEDDLKVLKTKLSEAEMLHKNEEHKVRKNKDDLQQLEQTLRQVQEYNEELKGEVAVTRRATYKAEETVTNMEKKKGDQDLYIDDLNETLKNLHEQLALFEAQLASQKQETNAAVETLRDAGSEMETIEFEKKQLMQQWKSSLIGIQRRDEALTATQTAIGEQQEEEKNSKAEIDGYKKAIRAEQVTNERLYGVMNKLDGESVWMNEKVKKFNDERSILEERFNLLKNSLEQTETQFAQLDLNYESVVQEISGLDKNLEAVARERKKLETEVVVKQAEQLTHSKAAKNLAKEAQAITQKIHEKESEESGVHNEMARIRVDTLNTKAHNQQLAETLEKLSADLAQKDKLIEKYEMEIRQRNDSIEKKMAMVDRLNRKYEKLVAGEPEEENLGPLEATIKHIGKETLRFQEENREIEKRWLTAQTDLVGTTEELHQVSGVASQMASEEAILKQKQIRVDRQIGQEEALTKKLNVDIRALHKDLLRLNDLVSKNEDLQKLLANDNYAMETEFINELKEMEEESIALDRKIQNLKEEKKELLKDVVESERQLLLWEKKIQLEKETQAALDPNVGMAESRAMEREIHRMRLRYEAIKRDQDKMVSEMERAIYKREAITSKYKKPAVKSKKPTPDEDRMTMAELKKKHKGMRRQVKKVHREIQQSAEMIKERTMQMEDMGIELEKSSAEYSKFEDEANQMQKIINNALYEKQRYLDMSQKNQRLLDRYNKARLGQIPPLLPEDEAQIDEELMMERKKREAIQGIIEGLAQQHGHLSEVLGRVQKLTEL